MSIQTAVRESIAEIPPDLDALNKVRVIVPIVRLIVRVPDFRVQDQLIGELAEAVSVDPRVIVFEANRARQMLILR